MKHFRDLLFQLLKHGTNTLHVMCIFLFSFHVAVAWLVVVELNSNQGSVFSSSLLCHVANNWNYTLLFLCKN